LITFIWSFSFGGVQRFAAHSCQDIAKRHGRARPRCTLLWILISRKAAMKLSWPTISGKELYDSFTPNFPGVL